MITLQEAVLIAERENPNRVFSASETPDLWVFHCPFPVKKTDVPWAKPYINKAGESGYLITPDGQPFAVRKTDGSVTYFNPFEDFEVTKAKKPVDISQYQTQDIVFRD